MNKEVLLAFYPNIGIAKRRALAARFSTWDEIVRAKPDIFREMKWKEKVIADFLSWCKTIDPDKLEKILAQEHITTITKDEEGYPALLKSIYDPPTCLFVRGEPLDNEPAIAIVGTRTSSIYGKQATEDLAAGAVRAGLTVVSGLAYGIDAHAHKATLDAGGKTIAVLAGGVNRAHVAPRSNAGLSEEIIAAGGTLVSEYPPGAVPNKFTFPMRNRIIAGLTLGTLVTEAGRKSGALITADYALNNAREVFTVPHPINSVTGAGPNNLIKSGAHVVTEIRDLLEPLNINPSGPTRKVIQPETEEEKAIVAVLSRTPTHIDDIIRESSLESATIGSTLALMEMKGMVKNCGGMHYATP